MKIGTCDAGSADVVIALRASRGYTFIELLIVATLVMILASAIMPLAKVTAGYQPLMPAYQGQLTEEQLLQLIEYIKSLPPRGVRSDKS